VYKLNVIIKLPVLNCLVEEKYNTLRVIYTLVEGATHPTQFACRSAEIIIHHNQPWDAILMHLNNLAAEGLINFITPALITITQTGITKMQSLASGIKTPGFPLSKKVA